MKEPKIDPKLVELIMRATREPLVTLEVDNSQLADQQIRKYIKYLVVKGDMIVGMLPSYKIQMKPGSVSIIWRDASIVQPTATKRRKRQESKHIKKQIDWTLKVLGELEAMTINVQPSKEFIYTQWVAAVRWQDSFIYDEVVDESYQRVVECTDTGQRFLDLVYAAFTDNLQAPTVKEEEVIDEGLPS